MPLYSPETQTNPGGETKNGAEMFFGLEGEKCTEANTITSWCYLFVHHRKVDMVSDILQKKHYPVFVHRSVVYKRESKRIKKSEKPTISGLIFVQGDGNDIQGVLKETFPGLYLAKDCCKGEIAAIPDRIMQPFMQVSKVNPTRIRFMPHSIDYYAEGNTLVKITSGVLAGLEGYRIRISRDKCLVTTLEGMTVAIGGIHKESFENMDEYVRLRREQLKRIEKRPDSLLTPLQQEIDKCFFIPQNQLDVMAMAESLRQWIARMRLDMAGKNFDEAVEIALFILEETGNHFQAADDNADIGNTDDIMALCREADSILESAMDNKDISVDLKEIMESQRESLAIRYPILHIEP